MATILKKIIPDLTAPSIYKDRYFDVCCVFFLGYRGRVSGQDHVDKDIVHRKFIILYNRGADL